MCFLLGNDSPRDKAEHEFVMQLMCTEPWIGPKKSMTIDTMHEPLFIGGCIANDKNITIG